MRVVVYTNILTPYRLHLFNAMDRELRERGDMFHVLLMAETESNRNWHYEDLKREYTTLLRHKTFTISGAYIHWNPDLKRTLQQLRPDVVIGAGSYLCPGVWDILRWKKRLGYRVFFWSESHENEARDYQNWKLRLREWIRKQVYSRFDGFWFAGALSRRMIEKYARSDALYHFMPNLVDEALYQQAFDRSPEQIEETKRHLGLNPANRVFLCPARLSRVKGIDRFFSMLESCPEKDRMTILIAGDGELRSQLETQAKEMEMDAIFLGFQNQEQMVELYSASDIVLLPSLSDPNPLTCIEALWAGLPLFLSSHCGNYPEVIVPGENGYVFDYSEPDKAITSLKVLLQKDDAWYRKAGALSHSIAMSNYRTDEVVKRAIQFLYDLPEEEKYGPSKEEEIPS